MAQLARSDLDTSIKGALASIHLDRLAATPYDGEQRRMARIRGSHHLYRKQGVAEKINLQRDDGHAKPYPSEAGPRPQLGGASEADAKRGFMHTPPPAASAALVGHANASRYRPTACCAALPAAIGKLVSARIERRQLK